MRGQLSIGCYGGPPVRQGLHGVNTSVDHGFDGDCHSWQQAHTPAGCAIIWYAWIFISFAPTPWWPTKSRTTEVAVRFQHTVGPRFLYRRFDFQAAPPESLRIGFRVLHPSGPGLLSLTSPQAKVHALSPGSPHNKRQCQC